MSTSLTPYQIVRYRVQQDSERICEVKRIHWVAHERAISPLSVKMWKQYRGYKREVSIWLTAIKILSALEPRNRDIREQLNKWTHRDTLIFWSHVTAHCKIRHGEVTPKHPSIVSEALMRLKRIVDQLEHGGTKKIRTYSKHSTDKEGKHSWSLVTDVTYVPKDFTKLEAEIKIMLTPRVKEAEHVTSGE